MTMQCAAGAFAEFSEVKVPIRYPARFVELHLVRVPIPAQLPSVRHANQDDVFADFGLGDIQLNSVWTNHSSAEPDFVLDNIDSKSVNGQW